MSQSSHILEVAESMLIKAPCSVGWGEAGL